MEVKKRLSNLEHETHLREMMLELVDPLKKKIIENKEFQE